MTESRFLRACRREPVDRTPVWFMRQAGRYLPEYRKLRERYPILELIKTPELAVEVTLQPLRRFDLDAAIIFADILPLLEGMGIELAYVKGDGPVIYNPVRRRADVEALRVPPPEENVPFTLEAIRLARQELDGRVPLIGFAGAPFTLASYLIEGGASRHYAHTKALMYEEPAAWHTLMERLTQLVGEYLQAQARTGAQALQLFDSWVGALSPADYREYVLPYSRRVIEMARAEGVPVIHFSTGTAGMLPLIREAGGDVIGVDWRIGLDEAWTRVGHDVAIQGNLDPVALLAPWPELRRRAADVLARAAGRPGHIFNLGHGVLPQTPVENVERLVEFVHEQDRDWRLEIRDSGLNSQPPISSLQSPISNLQSPQYAVLLMAYGGPNSLDDIEAYLLDIRGGRKTPQELVEEVRERYARIGGRSPLLDITRAQARALEQRLNAVPDGPRYRVYVGMRHWHPYIREAVAQIVADGLRDVVALCMAPHYSRMSVGAYFQKLEEAQKALGVQLNVAHVESYHDHPLFIRALAEKVQAALARFPDEEQVQVVFTAHSLPAALKEQGDPYDAQLRETARRVAAQVGLPEARWQFCYQSAGARNVKWLGPPIEEVVVKLAQAGHQHILVAPIGFVADHVEILYDIDIEARELAEQAGARLERTASLNTTPLFIEALADIVIRNTHYPVR